MDSQKKQGYIAIGLMTGTALDGNVDVAMIGTDGEKIHALGGYTFAPYSDSERELFAKAIKAALEWNFDGEPPKIIEEAKDKLTQVYFMAIQSLLMKTDFDETDIDIIGAHGLTLIHRPPINGENGRTLQILDGPKLAQYCGIEVAYDFRTNDMAHGGQGAPLAPIFHAAALEFAGIVPPCAILNLGGVANITYWSGGNDVKAFDCGPANGPLNELIEAHGLGTYDQDGKIAGAGKCNEQVLRDIMAQKFFTAPYPKSLDRYDFSAKLVSGLSLEDGAATLCALVGESVAAAIKLFETPPKLLVLAGGGRHNPNIVREIRNRAGIATINADEIGLSGDAMEAQCFAYLAVRAKLGLPLSFPDTTGVKEPICGGKIAAKPVQE